MAFAKKQVPFYFSY